jgi:hypothetical protein
MTTETTETLEAYQSGKPLDCEPGIYSATIKEIEKVTGEFGDQLRFTFTIDDVPDCEPWAWCSYKLGSQTKLWKWFTALKGRAPTIGEKVAPRDLVGCRCQLIIGPKKSKSGDEVLGVTDLLRAKGTKAPPQPPPPEDTLTATADVTGECWCGQPVDSFTAAGVALCEKHAKELGDRTAVQ